VRLGLDPNNPRWLKPAHGSSAPCFQCPPGEDGKPRRCNQVKGARSATTAGHTSASW
jgi:hypothetical protein